MLLGNTICVGSFLTVQRTPQGSWASRNVEAGAPGALPASNVFFPRFQRDQTTNGDALSFNGSAQWTGVLSSNTYEKEVLADR